MFVRKQTNSSGKSSGTRSRSAEMLQNAWSKVHNDSLMKYPEVIKYLSALLHNTVDSGPHRIFNHGVCTFPSPTGVVS